MEPSHSNLAYICRRGSRSCTVPSQRIPAWETCDLMHAW
jgi:hypothetical protein